MILPVHVIAQTCTNKSEIYSTYSCSSPNIIKLNALGATLVLF